MLYSSAKEESPSVPQRRLVAEHPAKAARESSVSARGIFDIGFYTSVGLFLSIGGACRDCPSILTFLLGVGVT